MYHRSSDINIGRRSRIRHRSQRKSGFFGIWWMSSRIIPIHTPFIASRWRLFTFIIRMVLFFSVRMTVRTMPVTVTTVRMTVEIVKRYSKTTNILSNNEIYTELTWRSFWPIQNFWNIFYITNKNTFEGTN